MRGITWTSTATTRLILDRHASNRDLERGAALVPAADDTPAAAGPCDT